MLFPIFGFLPCISAGVDPQDLREHVEIIMQAANIPSIEKLAIALEIDDDLLRRHLRGEGHFSLTRIVAKLGKEPGFWSRYAWLMACRYGVPEEAERSASLVMSLFRRNRPLKVAADLPQRREA